ncbi:hypothetical protein CLV24_101289 [Pontibacter ummariensis]|uniref:Uncharacterized protein n=1 Tax=Pontibacter ummariensis TaxID=1610492 RepID=A0A239BDW8_9BACT|nr:hypothetical protein [Pontibacter ummariensis]PRY16443.1 hypothetical protein CLV24_101289 [Pontibacter ummariensis]SNS05243.1 hypothetical protein SAMN06296052_101289 [Pontibacter ummariensis]
MQDTQQQAFDRIKGLPLTKTTRNEQTQYFHFGKTHYRTPQGLILDVGELTLAVNCPWQLAQADGTAIKHNEVFMRKREAGLPSPKFDWKVPGANLRDQRLMELINEGAALVVEQVDLLPDQGFVIRFANHSVLHVTPDPGNPAAYWQLFSNAGDGFKVGAGAMV